MAIREDVLVARPVTTVVAGVAVTACAVVAGAAAAVPAYVVVALVVALGSDARAPRQPVQQ